MGEFVPDVGFDLSGNWNPLLHEDFLERIPGPELVNYSGLPITEGSRLWGESWNSSRLTLPEHQCQVHVSPYIYRGPLQMRFWDEKDPQSQKIIAIKNYISTYEQTRTIWMDGRPHPPAWAAHTWMGFSTGKWEGNILTVYTTHIKQGWVRRDGLPESDQATLVEHFIRHGENLTHVSIVTDPVYLAEPLVKSEDFVLNTNAGGNWLYPCEEVEEVEGRPQRRGAELSARPESVHQRIRQHVPSAAGGGVGRPGNDVSGVREGDQEPASHSHERVPEGRGSRPWTSKTWRRTRIRPTAKFTFFRCRATSTCWWARAATSPCRLATWAC